MCTDEQILQSIRHIPAGEALEMLNDLKASDFRKTEIKGVMQAFDRLRVGELDPEFAEVIVAAMLDSEEDARRIFDKYHRQPIAA